MATINSDAILEGFYNSKNATPTSWGNGNYLNATFCVTEECNLACTYCYMVGKNSFHKMSFDTAKKIVDFLLSDDYCTGLTDNLMVDFIGGEPLLEIDLIDKITDYICLMMYVTKHKWFNNFQISFSTNGTLYNNPKVHRYVEKHRAHCGFAFSIDGTKEKHDLTRITKDGKGSYDTVMEAFKTYKEDFGEEIYQKSTFSSDDLIYLKDSIIHLWDLGFKEVQSNLVYEDVWKPGDAQIFETQLKELADYMFESGRYLTHSVSYFDKKRGLPLHINALDTNRCGAGYKSLAFDCEGNIYPCIRFLDMCAENKAKKIVGNINTGINYNALRALCGTTWNAVSNEECCNCSVGTDCGWCVAQNFQENGSLYKRVTAICEMHKANVRANKYFWSKYEKVTGKTSDRTIERVLYSQHNQLKYVYFITTDEAPVFCNYTKQYIGSNKMSESLYKQGLDFCLENEVLPIFLGDEPIKLDKDKKIFFEIDNPRSFAVPSRSIGIMDKPQGHVTAPIVNYLVNKSNIASLKSTVEWFNGESVKRLNIFITDIEKWNEKDLDEYEVAVMDVVDYIVSLYKSENFSFQINILTDRLYLRNEEKRDCGAGISSVALAPNGKFYICPGFYFTNPDWSIGTIESGIDESEKQRYFRDKSPMCRNCKAVTCNRCLLNSKVATDEINVPSSNQCRIGYIQANAQKILVEKLKKLMKENYMFVADNIPQLNYIDYVANKIYDDERALAKKWMYD